MEPQNATIVRLSPSTGGDNQISVVSFEEAFGEHSELHGRGRDRRQSRKMDRIAKKTDRKVARQGVKTAKKAAKQDRRAQQQEARQTRKDTRVTRRMDRKSLRQESRQKPESPPEEEVTTEEETQDVATQDSADQPQSDSGQGEYSSDEAAVMDQFAPDNGEDEQDDSSDSFDGDADSNAFTHDADGTSVSVDPAIADITKKIVWNQEAKRRVQKQKYDLDKQRAANKNNGRALSHITSQMADLDMTIGKHDDRIDELNRQLKTYGDHPHVGRGFHKAETELQKAKEVKSTSDDSAKIKDTIVSKGLDPQFGENRIDIPAYPALNEIEVQSNADGDQRIAIPKGTFIGAIGLLAAAALLVWATSPEKR